MNGTNQKLNNKKKRTRFYEIYLTKLLKQVSSENGITSNSKQQLNSILCSTTKLISTKVNQLTEMVRKKTTSEKEVINALNVMFLGDLGKGMTAMCKQAVENYNDDVSTKGITRQERAGIIFPPSVAEKYLRNFGYSRTMISNGAPVALAAAMEYFAGEILENAAVLAKQKKRVRITIRDLEMGVRTDNEINNFFEKNKFSFLGGGVVPYIHPNLLVKRTRRRKSKKSEGKRSHRYRPGTVSIREIRRFQKSSNCLTLAKSPFEKYTRSVIQKFIGNSDSIKVSKNVFLTLQYFVEQRIVSLLHKAYLAAIHTGRVKLTVSDIEFIRSLNITNTEDDPVKTLNMDDSSLPRDIKEEFEEIDSNNDGKISITEFKDWKDKQVKDSLLF
jgi:histone H3|tara:strand:- start:8474 stop:9634 length:1161 start_codon:yes stop_codon:yes gene_type:complete